MVWAERALCSEKTLRLEHTCLLVFTWYTLVYTFEQSGLQEVCPSIHISAKILSALTAHLERRDDSPLIKRVPFACSSLKKLMSDHKFEFCCEIGPKTLNITKNLNPRSQATDLLPDAESFEIEVQQQANIALMNDKVQLLNNLEHLRQELLD